MTGTPALTQLTSGGFHTCGLTASGKAWCWGANRSGQLGDGSKNFTPNPTPRLVVGDLTFVRITAGLHHTCGVTSDGALYCWGANGSGTAGDGFPSGDLVEPVRTLDGSR